MKKSTLLGGIIALNILGIMVAVSYREVFDVFLYGLNVMGMLVYYVETNR
jgi:predicted histidine transporter YuiF (NhaC family)